MSICFFISFHFESTEDNFYLYGLRNEIPHFRSCLNVILDIADHSMDPKTEASLDQHVMDLYGLIHARYILTKRGMDRMVSNTIISNWISKKRIQYNRVSVCNLDWWNRSK